MFELLPNEVGLIAASFVGTVLYAILTSVALAFIGVGRPRRPGATARCSTGPRAATPSSSAPGGGTSRPGVCAALLGTSLVLLNFGLDELGNPAPARGGRGAARRRPRVAPVRPHAGDPRRRDRGDDREPRHRARRHGAAAAGHPRSVDRLPLRTSGDIRAVRGVDLALHPGSIVGLAGESGCGKSTLAYGSVRLLRPPAVVTGGSVTYYGRRIAGDGFDVLAADHAAAACAALARDRDRLPERDERAQPGAADRDQLLDALRAHTPATRGAAARARRRDDRDGRHPACAACAATRTSCRAVCASG